MNPLPPPPTPPPPPPQHMSIGPQPDFMDSVYEWIQFGNKIHDNANTAREAEELFVEITRQADDVVDVDRSLEAFVSKITFQHHPRPSHRADAAIRLPMALPLRGPYPYAGIDISLILSVPPWWAYLCLLLGQHSLWHSSSSIR